MPTSKNRRKNGKKATKWKAPSTFRPFSIEKSAKILSSPIQKPTVFGLQQKEQLNPHFVVDDLVRASPFGYRADFREKARLKFNHFLSAARCFLMKGSSETDIRNYAFGELIDWIGDETNWMAFSVNDYYRHIGLHPAVEKSLEILAPILKSKKSPDSEYSSEEIAAIKGVGSALNKIGGIRFMQNEDFWMFIPKTLHREIEYMWHGIGEWQA